MAGNGCQQGFRSVTKFVSCGQESISGAATSHMQTVVHHYLEYEIHPIISIFIDI